MGPLRKTGNRFSGIYCLELLPHSGAYGQGRNLCRVKVCSIARARLECLGTGGERDGAFREGEETGTTRGLIGMDASWQGAAGRRLATRPLALVARTVSAVVGPS